MEQVIISPMDLRRERGATKQWANDKAVKAGELVLSAWAQYEPLTLLARRRLERVNKRVSKLDEITAQVKAAGLANGGYFDSLLGLKLTFGHMPDVGDFWTHSRRNDDGTWTDKCYGQSQYLGAYYKEQICKNKDGENKDVEPFGASRVHYFDATRLHLVSTMHQAEASDGLKQLLAEIGSAQQFVHNTEYYVPFDPVV
jgi:hypothetical protein